MSRGSKRKVPRRTWVNKDNIISHKEKIGLVKLKIVPESMLVEVVLKGEETKKVCRRLERWLRKYDKKYFRNAVIVDSIVQELKRIGGG